MPKYVCKCGEIINLSPIPTPNQYQFISDVNFDKFVGQIDAEEIYGETEIMLKCPKCDRLHVFWSGFENGAKVYNPERK